MAVFHLSHSTHLIMNNNLLLGLVSFGLLFSGYLSGIKFFNEVCAFNESCPYFFGYPACYFGFGMYLVMFIFLIAARMGKASATMLQGVLSVSFLGILFAGYFTVKELATLFDRGFSEYVLGLPTCAYGLVVFVAIFAVAMKLHRKE